MKFVNAKNTKFKFDWIEENTEAIKMFQTLILIPL